MIKNHDIIKIGDNMQNDLSLIEDFNMEEEKQNKYFDAHIDKEIEILEKFELLNELVDEDKNNA